MKLKNSVLIIKINHVQIQRLKVKALKNWGVNEIARVKLLSKTLE